jgi:hypothetical protein
MDTQSRIVFINSNNHLSDTTGHDCRYRTASGQRLLPGYWYVVSWPEDVEEPLFDAHARYAGPYDSVATARNTLGKVSNPALFASKAPPGDTEPSRMADGLYVADWQFDH